MSQYSKIEEKLYSNYEEHANILIYYHCIDVITRG